mmetsp:Transcript_19783/g.39426  ORF Transcript_19783/g.39426 Transcript_19783/m.39426 type:complete len:81 (+) Transcript_19783:72-314(+)
MSITLSSLIPEDFQLASIVLTGLVGFMLVVALSNHATKAVTKTESAVQSATPTKKKKPTLGSVNTPSGIRRSARVASRKE